MVEPAYEDGSAETRARVDRLNYVKGLPAVIDALGHQITHHELLESWRRDYQSSVLVIDKTPQEAKPIVFCSPLSGATLLKREGYYYSCDDGLAFPVIEGIPCLTSDSGVLAYRLIEAT